MSEFAQALLSMGFASYGEYLKSPLWADVRWRVYAAKGRMCLVCKERRATQIHHRQYDIETLKGETLNYLVPICRQCHKAEHGIEPREPVPVVVIPWNPKQRCPSKRSKTPGNVLHARQKHQAKLKREARRAKLNASMTRPSSVVCKECKRTVALPPDIAWANYVCLRCSRALAKQAADKERIAAAKAIRERGEQAMRMARASLRAEPNSPSGALREFVKRARMGASSPTDCERTRHDSE